MFLDFVIKGPSSLKKEAFKLFLIQYPHAHMHGDLRPCNVPPFQKLLSVEPKLIS